MRTKLSEAESINTDLASKLENVKKSKQKIADDLKATKLELETAVAGESKLERRLEEAMGSIERQGRREGELGRQLDRLQQESWADRQELGRGRGENTEVQQQLHTHQQVSHSTLVTARFSCFGPTYCWPGN